MKTATINRIRENSCQGVDTIIGVYSYRLAYDHNRECWDIFRAKTEDVAREWINSDGQIVSAWQPMGLSGMVEAQTIAWKLREEGEWNGEWNPDLCERLAALAGMADEYREADGETFEAVLFKAAEVLGVEII